MVGTSHAVKLLLRRVLKLLHAVHENILSLLCFKRIADFVLNQLAVGFTHAGTIDSVSGPG